MARNKRKYYKANEVARFEKYSEQLSQYEKLFIQNGMSHDAALDAAHEKLESDIGEHSYKAFNQWLDKNGIGCADCY